MNTITPDYESPRAEQILLRPASLLCVSPTTAEDLNEKYDWEDELWGS